MKPVTVTFLNHLSNLRFIPPVTWHYRSLHPHYCKCLLYLISLYAFVFSGTFPHCLFLSHAVLPSLLMFFSLSLLPPVNAHWWLTCFPCSALLCKILLFTLSQEAPATSSPLNTPVSRWHSVILFFSSQYALLPLRCTGQETMCLCAPRCVCVSSKRTDMCYKTQKRPTVRQNKFLTALLDVRLKCDWRVETWLA